MVRNSEIITCSIKKEQGEFLDAVKLSASELLQDKIKEQMEVHRKIGTSIASFERKIQLLQEEIARIHKFLDYCGKSNDYFKWLKERQDGN